MQEIEGGRSYGLGVDLAEAQRASGRQPQLSGSGSLLVFRGDPMQPGDPPPDPAGVGLQRIGGDGLRYAGLDGLHDEQEIALLCDVAFARQPDIPGLNVWLKDDGQWMF